MNKRKLILHIFSGLLILVVFVLPLLTSAAGLVPCGGDGEPVCDFNQFMVLLNTVINTLIFWSVTIIAPLLFVYAGFLLITSGGSPGKKDQAKNVFKKTVIGLLIMLSAWLVVNTLLESFIDPRANIDIPLDQQ